MKQIKSLTVLKKQQIFYQIDFETNQEIGISKVSKKNYLVWLIFV